MPASFPDPKPDSIILEVALRPTVTTPPPKRRWGYYVFPKIYGDDLEARLDPKLDCTTMTLAIKGFWHEDDAPIKSAEFANALALGLACFAKYLNAQQIDLNSVKPIGLKKELKKTLGEQLKVT